MSKFTDFDVLLIGQIRDGNSTFAKLQNATLLAAAAPFAADNRRGDDTRWRVIDRRLQALRKQGHIRFEGGAWVIAAARSAGRE